MASEVKVNKISPRSGTGLQLGDSGDTISVPTGAGFTSADEVKTNKISPASGTSFTLGDSGDTFTIPSGVTLSNSGTASGFGAIDWQTSDIKTGNFTASAGEGYFVNTSSTAITVSLPAGVAGAQVAFVDYAGTWDSNNCTISPNGSDKIQGSTDDAVFSRDREAFQLVFVDGTQGWLIESVTDQGGTQATYISASGGTETTDGDFNIHSEISSGIFTVSTVGNSRGGGEMFSYLFVAGGGGGGARHGGGGGAGGFRDGKVSSDPYSDSPLDAGDGLTVTAQAYPITVGAGGSGQPGGDTAANPGAASVFSTISSAGGGRGGGFSPGRHIASAGGSGGGGFGFPSDPSSNQNGGAGNTPPVSPPQGNSGGPGENHGCSGGGGGGATGGGGGTSSPGKGGDGGAGASTSITGSSVARGGGGGGGGNVPSSPVGAGGAGGGGSGSQDSSPAASGTANTGGGGGGNRSPDGGDGASGSGGSGIVVIRYKFQN